MFGTWPYALVNKKLDGSYAWFNLDLPSFIPNPILSGLGIISSSALSLIPAPNWISNWLFVLNLVINLRVDFFNFKRYGVCWLYCCNRGSAAAVFSISSKIVSWAK